MRTNIEIDDELMAQAMEVSGTKSKRETVAKALAELVRMQKQRAAYEGLRALKGSLSAWDGDLDTMRRDKPDSPWLQ
jgi:Arc/MetJ family transcription regulator